MAPTASKGAVPFLLIQRSEQSPERLSRSSRRWLFAVGGLLASAAAIFLAVWLGSHGGEGLSEQFVLDEAIRTFDAAVDVPGTTLAEKPAPAEYPFSPAVVTIRGVRWRPADGIFAGRRGVIYQLPGVAGNGAALFVVDAEAADDFAEMPAIHPFTTAGCCARHGSNRGGCTCWWSKVIRQPIVRISISRTARWRNVAGTLRVPTVCPPDFA